MLRFLSQCRNTGVRLSEPDIIHSPSIKVMPKTSSNADSSLILPVFVYGPGILSLVGGSPENSVIKNIILEGFSHVKPRRVIGEEWVYTRVILTCFPNISILKSVSVYGEVLRGIANIHARHVDLQ